MFSSKGKNMRRVFLHSYEHWGPFHTETSAIRCFLLFLKWKFFWEFLSLKFIRSVDKKIFNWFTSSSSEEFTKSQRTKVFQKDGKIDSLELRKVYFKGLHNRKNLIHWNLIIFDPWRWNWLWKLIFNWKHCEIYWGWLKG